MARRVFYSFHFQPDNWRAAQVRNIGMIEGNEPAADNDWEDVKKGRDEAIKQWINNQLNNRSCTVVLIGSHTAKRKWINYEIRKSWNDGMGVVGIYIHGLKDLKGNTSTKGLNPFNFVNDDRSGKKLSSIAQCYTPEGSDSQDIYSWIKNNLANIVEGAIHIRNSQ